jgi:hypothetical protein
LKRRYFVLYLLYPEVFRQQTFGLLAAEHAFLVEAFPKTEVAGKPLSAF